MSQIIVWAVFFIGLAGMTFMIKTKMPVLAELDYREKTDFRIKSRVSFKNIIQKILLMFRGLIVRTERKTTNLLFKLHNQSEKNKFSEDYWRKLKKRK